MDGGTIGGMSEHTLFAHIDDTTGVLTARLVGPAFGEREGEVVYSMLESATNPGHRALVLDFTDVNFVNSAGLGACGRWLASSFRPGPRR